ncbi:MAG: transposase [Halobacteriota archaeon]
MESLKFTRINKKIRRTTTKWAGFNLMLYVYVLYGLGIVNILEDMKVEKRSNCVYTPLQISLAYIVKITLGFKNAYGMDEELRKAHQAIIHHPVAGNPRIRGWGGIAACDSSKIRVDGLTYEGAEEVFDYQTKENVRGYKLFVIYDVVYRIPIYFEVQPINDADAPPLQEMVKKAKEIIQEIEAVGKGRRRKYRIEGYKAGIEVLDGNEKEEMFICLTNAFNALPEQIIENYSNRWLIETMFEEANEGRVVHK